MRYFKEILIAGVLCVATSCSDDPLGPTATEFEYQGVTFRARVDTDLGPQTYRIFLSAYNESSTTVSFSVAGPCMMKPRLYRDGRLAFDGIVAFRLCPNDVFNFTLAPHDSLPGVWGSVVGPDVLGDSLPGGRYRIVAALRPEGVGGPVHELFVRDADF